MNDTANDTRDQQLDEEARAGDRAPRLPYEAPRMRSGQAFERVVLASGECNEATFCPIPC